MNKMRYSVVIATHIPPTRIFSDTIKKLSLKSGIHVYVVDSSPKPISTQIKSFIDGLKRTTTKNQTFIFYYRVLNFGVGHNFNVGIQQAIQDGTDLITLFTDDVSLSNKTDFKLEEIYNYFYSNCCNKKDVLILPQNQEQFLWENIMRTVDSGMTFSKDLFNKIKFREEFVLDQTDYDFCHQITANGGKFVVYPKVLIDFLPVGREDRNSKHSIPHWRLYLLTRNSISIVLESPNKLGTLKTQAFPQIAGWSISGIKSGQNVLGIFEAVLLGFIDGVSKKQGITNNLQMLSGNRFSKKN